MKVSVGRFVTPRERMDMAALELFASIGRPLASKVQYTLEGIQESDIPVSPPEVVYAGTPVVVHGICGGRADGSQVVSSTEYFPVASMITRTFALGACSLSHARKATTPSRVRGKAFQGSARIGVLGKRWSDSANAASKVAFDTSIPTQCFSRFFLP
jgi:hypothetical protein